MRFRDSLAVLLLLSWCVPALAAAPAQAPGKAKAPAGVKAAAKPKTQPATAPEPAPADAATLVTQARAAAARGENDLAIVLAQSAIVADPSRPASYDALGDVYAGQSQPEFARNFYAKALDIDPADADATRAMAALDRAADKTVAADRGAKPAAP